MCGILLELLKDKIAEEVDEFSLVFFNLTDFMSIKLDKVNISGEEDVPV